ncbi:D-tagatose-1,6-bisphosphate aldolase subunit KbaY [Propionispora sp. 2/2-37]|uniref:ketose-bisphosphate aldolase n=1 Tax=Propionispora sp. 2/2-37 TaxID=1677858 RepID=UPI0006BB6986|nr:ketose-bisphosphate aldolase [Propionispora sp. 2/2-37]CUH97658.1 D-tagatose-1,6-bisphosphate aldolase subunit KbaY [Propionispora sp. 2/2-37]
MLYTMKDLLAVARKHKFAVPAFNISSHEILRAVLEACGETESPVILEIHPVEIEHLTDTYIDTVRRAAYEADFPVVIHLDHGETVTDVMRAIRNGYTSVMIDASKKSYEDNIKQTREIVSLAHAVHVSVEAELGTIGAMNYSAEGGVEHVVYTDPAQAKDFVEKTGIDTLAVAIGTAHGLYPKNFVPKLDLQRLGEINQAVDIPLVLHGGSGNPDEEISRSVALGVCKVNISSDVKSAFFNECRRFLAENPGVYEPNEVFPGCIAAARDVIKHKLGVLNTLGKRSLYR